jgi:hypothetical protein
MSVGSGAHPGALLVRDRVTVVSVKQGCWSGTAGGRIITRDTAPFKRLGLQGERQTQALILRAEASRRCPGSVPSGGRSIAAAFQRAQDTRAKDGAQWVPTRHALKRSSLKR